jgi:predicted component of type VI protein secretion system
MTLVLHCLALNEKRMSQPLIGRFDERGGTLGRADTATFTLPDPERIISRVQAQVLHRDDGYWIENVGSASPILHNGRLLSPGMRVVLSEGDELRIGGYSLQASFEDDESSETILRGRTGGTYHGGAERESRTTRPESELSGSSPPPRATLARSSAPSSAAAETDGESPVEAFFRGAGLDPKPFAAMSPEQFAAIGTMLRTAVDGIHRLISMRALAKDEMQAQMTMIQMNNNNPLKAVPDARVALQLLLQPPTRGFLGGTEAMRDALVDLQSHQVGVMVGMRAALEEVLERFDPAKLESSLSKRSVLDTVLPAARRARLWELYLEHYRLLREEAREDFERFFGEAFREAYEAQVRSLDV